MTKPATESGDEWEEVIMIAEVNGVLDANLVRQAANTGNVALRHAESSTPILQISNSIYSGKWARTIGSDIILEAEDGQLKVLSTTDRYLKTEKALLTAKDEGQANGKNTPKIKNDTVKKAKPEKK